MTDSAHTLACKFTAPIEKSHGRYVVEIPEAELHHGTLTTEEPCQITIYTSDGEPQSTPDEHEQEAPVSVGERRTVEIEDTGEQGDGITRVGRGYVLIVAGATPGDEVTIKIEKVFPNYAFASLIEKSTSTTDKMPE